MKGEVQMLLMIHKLKVQGDGSLIVILTGQKLKRRRPWTRSSLSVVLLKKEIEMILIIIFRTVQLCDLKCNIIQFQSLINLAVYA